MKKDYQITRQFQDDLIEAYKKVAPYSWTQTEAYRRTVKSPAPRYYVTPKQAAQVIAEMVRGDFSRVNLMRESRKRMYYSLFKKVMELSEKREYCGKSLRYICTFAVVQPAPEFFVKYTAVREVRRLIKNEEVDDEGRRILSPAKQLAYERLKEKRNEENRKLLEYRRMRKALRAEMERKEMEEKERESD